MIWNKPSEAQLAKYSKGYTLDVLYPPTKIIPDLCKPYTFNQVENLTDKHLMEDSNMVRVLNNEKKGIEERTKRHALIAEEDEKIKDTIRQLLNLQKNPSFPIHYSYEVLPTDTEGNLNIKLRPKYKFGKEHHKNCYSLWLMRKNGLTFVSYQGVSLNVLCGSGNVLFVSPALQERTE